MRLPGDRAYPFYAVPHVSFWHLADITAVLGHVRFRE
jgi:hypothetical protein